MLTIQIGHYIIIIIYCCIKDEVYVVSTAVIIAYPTHVAQGALCRESHGLASDNRWNDGSLYFSAFRVIVPVTVVSEPMIFLAHGPVSNSGHCTVQFLHGSVILLVGQFHCHNSANLT